MGLEHEEEVVLPDEPEVQKNFKDFLAEDVDDVFFCLDEFAETHNIDGKDMPAVVEKCELIDHSSHWEAGAKQNFDSNLYDEVIILYVKKADYNKKPKVQMKLQLDNEKMFHRVIDWEEEADVYRMQIGKVRQ